MNELKSETSPYLLQHATNPVNWHAWNENSLQLAAKENKLLLISVGYAACHWCHVMEKESFEDQEVAGIMNRHFVNIKVDREERPDVDQLYMSAVQVMTGGGGWPMNVVALPDGRPFWGGTYFRKEKWMHSLQQIAQLYEQDPEKIEEYANNLAHGLRTIHLPASNDGSGEFNAAEIDHAVKNWSRYFDHEYGGMKRAPKFMMPVNLNFMLHYGLIRKDEVILNFVDTTLTKIAWGGVFDPLSGGFSRYSVDERWHVPHFEKMLYDNGQLVSVYSNAYSVFKKELYRTVVEKTLRFTEQELMNENHAFFSSLDADSNNPHGEHEEGAYYCWKEEELKAALDDDFDVFADYYNINEYGHWENGNYVLIRNSAESEIARRHGITTQTLTQIISACESKLLKLRQNRDRPGLDDKSLTSWNAIMLKGYCDAYRVFGNREYLEMAKANATFIRHHQFQDNGSLYHSYKDGRSTINGFLEDYALVIEAFIALYEVSTEEEWLLCARDLTNHLFDHFFDEASGMFFFSQLSERVVVTRIIEVTDNVIPASNSVMAHNLFKLSHYFSNDAYRSAAKKMLHNVQPHLNEYGYSHANWLSLMLHFTNNFYEVAVCGEKATTLLQEIGREYIPNCILAGSTKESKLPLLKDRYISQESLIFVCENQTCQLPVRTAEEALKQLRQQ